MNVFVLSPGRTATMSIAEAFAVVPGYTTGHETRVKELGEQRIAYPPFHLECDNRLTWFLPRLTERFSESAVLVVVHRDQDAIARSYQKRWFKTNIMKAYAQGVLLRDFKENDLDVCRDYVRSAYEQIEFARSRWRQVIDLDLEKPEPGTKAILDAIDRSDYTDLVVERLCHTHANSNRLTMYDRASIVWYAIRNLVWDLRACFR